MPPTQEALVFGDHLLAAPLLYYISQRLRNRIHAGPSPVRTSDTGQSLDGLLGVHARPERIGEDLGHGVEDGRAAVTGLAEPDEGLEGDACIVGGDGDVWRLKDWPWRLTRSRFKRMYQEVV